MERKNKKGRKLGKLAASAGNSGRQRGQFERVRRMRRAADLWGSLTTQDRERSGDCANAALPRANDSVRVLTRL